MSISDRDLLATVVQHRDAVSAEERPGVFVLVVTEGPERGRAFKLDAALPVRERLANTNVPVVIEGETGTGKEALAESLHEMGPRAQGPFVVFDCTAVPPSLVEAELFGHERGAFTGALQQRKGVFEQAQGG